MGKVFQTVTAPISAVGQVLSDPMGTHAIQSGMNSQADATAQSNATLQNIYNQQRSDAMPWEDAGKSALTQMQDPSFNHAFSMSDFQADPGYQFRMQQGQQALEASAAARGGLSGGNFATALTQYGQNFASNEYQNAYNRFNQNQQNRFNRLSTIAGIGQNALTGTMGAAQSYGNGVSQNQMGLGNAYAAGNMAMAKANQGFVGSGLSLAAMMG